MEKITNYFNGLICLISLLLGVTVFAEVIEIKEQVILCRIGKNVRLIRIKPVDNNTEKKCSTTYTKYGVEREVGYGQHWYSCNKFSENVKGNLVKAGWQCRLIDSGNEE